MRTQSLFFVVLVFCVVSSGSKGQPAKPDCSHTVIQPELNACAEDDYAATDAQLNYTYKAFIAHLPDGRSRQKARAEERVWILRRDKKCGEEVGPNPGIGASMWNMEMADCLKEVTRLRIKELRSTAP
jgi:uncharacterized protein YecT (DUF1311 family)